MKQISLTLVILAFLGLQVTYAQTREISGTVTYSGDGSAIPGASVVVKGTTIGTITDMDGKFSLKVPLEEDIIIISFVGMYTKEVSVKGVNTVKVELSTAEEQIDEVVVVAYGTATKSSITGAITKVEGEKLASKNTTEVSKALVGEVAGLQVINTTGQPGQSAQIRIRGLGSVNASKAPLYVVNGMPYNGNLASINPTNIESISVLKDASATALYGSRGSNGVILITTKKGAKGESKIEVELKYGINSRELPLYDVIDSPETYAELSWESLYNATKATLPDAERRKLASKNLFTTKEGIPAPYNLWDIDEPVGVDGKMKPNAKRRYTMDSWKNEIFSPGKRLEANLKLSGGENKTNYFTSIGMLDEKGYYIGSDYTRFTTKVNVGHEVKKWLKGGFDIDYAHSKMNKPGQDDIMNSGFQFVNFMPSLFPVFERDSLGNKIPDPRVGGYKYDYGIHEGYGRPFGNAINPAGALKLDKEPLDMHNVNVNGNINVDIFNGLKFNTAFGIQYYDINKSLLTNPFYGDAKGLGRIGKERAYHFSYTWNQILNYTKKYGQHNISAFLAHEATYYENNRLYGTKSKIANPFGLEWNNAVIMSSMNSYTNNYALESYFGQVKYDYDEKYFLHGTLRRDGTSRFPNNPWGTFSSIGFAWNINKEGFMSDLSFVDYLKLKISWGTIGNQDLGFYPTVDLYNVDNLNDEISISFRNKGNRELTWERSSTLNSGIEFELWNRLSGGLEYFHKTTDNLLFAKQMPPSLGYTKLNVNDGELLNTGIEFNLKAEIVKASDFYFALNLNGAKYKNEIVRMPIDPATGKETDIEIKGGYGYTKGRSLYDFYVREYVGVDEKTGKPQWNSYIDKTDKDPEKHVVITDLFKYMIDNPDAKIEIEKTDDYSKATKTFANKSVIPKLSGGFGLETSYKGFSLRASFAYSYGGYSYDNVYATLMGNPVVGSTNWHVDILSRWQKEKDKTDVPRLNNSKDKYGNSASDRFITSNSYLHLNNIRIAYNVQKQLLNKVKIKGLEVFISADNLMLLSARKGFYPIMGESGASQRSHYVPMTSITGGINLSF